MNKPLSYDYLKDPDAIYRKSFETVKQEADLSHLPEGMKNMAIRLIHACGMTDLPADLAWHNDPVMAGQQALKTGAPILVDAMMVRHGIIDRFLPTENKIICTLNDENVAKEARQQKTTRSAAAINHWRDHLEGSVVCIGNAPTALFHLLEMLADGAPKPAVIMGFPVGFVGASESKEALIRDAGDIPYVTLRGRRGGSAIAAAAVNALSIKGTS